MSRIGAVRSVAAASLAAAVIGCQDTTTGPEAVDVFDTRTATADFEAMDGVLESSGWASFLALASRQAFASAAGPAAASAAIVEAAGRLTGKADARAFAVEVVRRATRTSGPSAAPIISEGSRGTTFVWDEGAGRYVPDPARTGAPPTGVRFILYEESAGRPDPSREVGYVDLIDEGDASREDVVLRLVGVHRGRTVVDYRTRVDRVGAGGRVRVDGYLQNDTDRLRFDVDAHAHGGDPDAVDVDFEMGIDARDFEVVGSVRARGDDGPGAVDVSVRHGDDSLRVTVQDRGPSLAGTFYLDGAVFATVSGDPDAPTFVSADGDPLTTLEIGVLFHIVGVVEVVLGLFQGLVAPVAGLVALGIVL
ncbi:MAG: hypothetical protein PVI57_19005 [Gemmatimonadota bacterium]|jgi:hypothetical protein